MIMNLVFLSDYICGISLLLEFYRWFTDTLARLDRFASIVLVLPEHTSRPRSVIEAILVWKNDMAMKT